MKYITSACLDNLKAGATLLGSGGGGDPFADHLLAKHLLQGRSLELTQVEELTDDDLIVAVGYAGAPLVSSEKLSSAGGWERGLQRLESILGKKITALVAAEIGGSNAFSPIVAALETGRKLIDGDTLGRAFPRLDISSCALAGISGSPTCVVDCTGSEVLLFPENTPTLEKLARAAVIAMGSTGAVLTYVMSGREAQTALLHGTVSQAIALGKTLLSSKSITVFLAQTPSCRLLAIGTIIDIQQSVEGGFLEGSLKIATKSGTISLYFQNEFLAASIADQPLGTTPDILTLLNGDTLEPILSDKVRFGQFVHLVQLKSPALWRTALGLEKSAPAAFGIQLPLTVIQ